MEHCIFCKIAQGQASASIVWESEDVLAFRDLFPKAKTHILIIPKKHIASLNDLTESEEHIMGTLMCTIPKIAKTLNLDHFQLKCHTGKESGQIIFHLHLHLIQH